MVVNMPNNEHIVLNTFESGYGEMHVVVHSLYILSL